MAELADGVHDLCLAALEMPDEMPPERVAVARVLGLEVLRAVLADDGDARYAERLHVVERDVLRRNDDRDTLTHLSLQALVALAQRVRRRRQ